MRDEMPLSNYLSAMQFPVCPSTAMVHRPDAGNSPAHIGWQRLLPPLYPNPDCGARAERQSCIK